MTPTRDGVCHALPTSGGSAVRVGALVGAGWTPDCQGTGSHDAHGARSAVGTRPQHRHVGMPGRGRGGRTGRLTSTPGPANRHQGGEPRVAPWPCSACGPARVWDGRSTEASRQQAEERSAHLTGHPWGRRPRRSHAAPCGACVPARGPRGEAGRDRWCHTVEQRGPRSRGPGWWGGFSAGGMTARVLDWAGAPALGGGGGGGESVPGTQRGASAVWVCRRLHRRNPRRMGRQGAGTCAPLS